MPSKYLIRYITVCMHTVMYCIWTSLIIPCQKEFNMFSKLFRPVEWISCHIKNENNIKWLWKTYGKTSLSVHLWYRFWFTKCQIFVTAELRFILQWVHCIWRNDIETVFGVLLVNVSTYQVDIVDSAVLGTCFATYI